ncbi:hypothetical protein DEO72_LG3g2245 [Vigna unguiculata]|uniref:Uncharacterized protein n=1 Tax=Vigna unguiculata TaxID=3917 RepID=A0A4D6LHA5_VIGUN|nr:hypothetical protein DEO72_LG3g2245 [Vigna unguiculata]
MVLNIIGVVNNVRCNPQSKNVVFHIRDFRSSSVMKASSNPETIACIRSKLETKMIKEFSGEGTCDSSSEANSKGKKSFGIAICDSNNEAETICVISCGSQAKDSSPTGVSRFSTRSNAVGLIQTKANAKKVQDSSPTIKGASSTQSKRIGVIRSASHGTKIFIIESSLTDICVSTPQSKTIGSSKIAALKGKDKQSTVKATCEENIEADMCMLTLSTSGDNDPYIDYCVTPRKELLLDFKVECDHLDDIPSAEFSRTKTKKRIKQEKQ